MRKEDYISFLERELIKSRLSFLLITSWMLEIAVKLVSSIQESKNIGYWKACINISRKFESEEVRMSNVLVNIPDDGWISPDSFIKPEDKMLCVVIHAYGDRTPEIYQFRKADWMHKESDYFLDVTEKWRMDSYGCGAEWEPGFATFGIIHSWKPLGLPEKANQRILKDIESWFEEDE